MADLGEMPHVIEAVLNHVSGQRAGVAGIYNRALYKAEKAQALVRWATHVLAIAKGSKSNVTSMERGMRCQESRVTRPLWHGGAI